MSNSTDSIFLSNVTRQNPAKRSDDAFAGEISIALYSLIFLLSVAGNVCVMLTLFRQKNMRTITNMFLLNLAVSDLLLSVLCMPFTLTAILLRNFIFGETMCILIRFFQAVSVGVSCYTLVAISLERFFAICQPLRSLRWQTASHARRMIVAIWLVTIVTMSPIAAFQRLLPLRKGGHACREIWPKVLLAAGIDKVYSVALVVILLVVPLVSMATFYGLIAKTLWLSSIVSQPSSVAPKSGRTSQSSSKTTSIMLTKNRHARDITNRKRVIKMMVVVVLQYFICWTPTYTFNAWQSIDFRSMFTTISPTTKSLVLLLAYTSSFIHPITYCFMNKRFRTGFQELCQCMLRCEDIRQLNSHNTTD